MPPLAFMPAVIQFLSKALSASIALNVTPWINGAAAMVSKRFPWQLNELHEVVERIGQRGNPGGPAAQRLAWRLTFSPTFEPCPAARQGIACNP